MNEATTTGAPKRPTFLTVLCILSFIASGIWMIIYAVGLAAGGIVSAAASVANDSGDPALIEQAESAQDAVAAGGGNLAMIAGIGLALTIITLIGVIMMWKLKKMGYYVFTGATLIAIVAPVMMGKELDMTSAVVGALFVVLYGLNLKHMS